MPRLADQAGPKLAKSQETSVAAALRGVAAEPGDAEALASLIASYRYANRYEDAFQLRDKLPLSAAAFSAADEQTGWAVNNMALTLHDAGKSREADALFAALNSAVRDHWRINMMINRIGLLVRDGKFAEALPLITETRDVSKSPYAEQLLRQMRYCALARLNRRAEAAKLRSEMITRAKDAMSATVDGLLCAGELDAAEDLALRGLAGDEEFEADFVRSLQTRRLTADDSSVWGGWSALRQRPAVAAAFTRLGREMPDDMRAHRQR